MYSGKYKAFCVRVCVFGGGGGYTLMTGFVTTIFHVTADGYVVLLSNYF